MEDRRTRYCRNCGQRYAHNVFTCPRCNMPTALLNNRGVRAKHKSRFSIGIVSLIAVVFLTLLYFHYGSLDIKTSSVASESAPSKNEITSTPRPTRTPQQTMVPEPTFSPISGTVGNWEITVNNFSYQEAISAGLLHEYEAKENSKYCLVNVTVKNIGKTADTFLPYISFGDSATAKIEWNGYEYIRSELLLSNDNLSNEQLNPLVATTGDIAFNVPEDLINSDIPPTFIVKNGDELFSCELVRK